MKFTLIIKVNLAVILMIIQKNVLAQDKNNLILFYEEKPAPVVGGLLMNRLTINSELFNLMIESAGMSVEA